MVQIWQGPETPMGGFGKGLGQGLANVAQMGLQMKMQDMMAAKQEARQQVKIFNAAQQLAKIETKNPQLQEQLTAHYTALGMINPEFMMSFSQRSAAEKQQMLQDSIAYSEPERPRMAGFQDQDRVQQQTQRPQQQQMDNMYPMQMGYGQQGTQSAIHSQSVNPVVLPYRQEQMNQPAQVSRPSVQSSTPSTQAPTEEDRFATVNTLQGPQRMVKSLEAARTLGEARPYIRHFYPQKDWKAAENQWMNLQTLATRQEKVGLEKEKIQMAKEEKRIAREEKKSEPFRTNINNLREKVLKEKTALDLAETAIKTGDTSSLLQYWANKHNLDPLKTPSTAILNAASKEFLTGGVRALGSKGVNQFIEQRMLGMFPAVGQSEEANLSVIEALRAEMDLDKKKIELYDQFEEVYKKEPSKIEKAVYDNLNKYADTKKDELAYKLSQIRDDYASDSELASTKQAIPGAYITPKRAQALKKLANGDARKAQEIAIKLGYKFPGEE